MAYNVAGVVLSNVAARNIVISGVTVVGASAQEIADLIIRRDKSIRESDSEDISKFRAIYSVVTQYVDGLRTVTASLTEAIGIEIICEFTHEYVSFMKTGRFADTLEAIEGLTTLGMLYRLYGQFCQLQQARHDNLVRPPTLAHHRENLTATGADRGNFLKAETALREALKLCEEKLGVEHPQNIVIHNELGLLHRDKGEYKKASEEFALNFKMLHKQNRVSDKPRWSEVYFNQGITYRDRLSHNLAAWAFWSASVYKESAGLRLRVVNDKFEASDAAVAELEAMRKIFRYQLQYAGLFTLFAVVALSIISACVRWFGSEGVVALCWTLGVYLGLRWLSRLALGAVAMSLATFFIEGIYSVYWPDKAPSEYLTGLANNIIGQWKDFRRSQTT
jgi:tetratricopeptide (TPR) repeat protein